MLFRRSASLVDAIQLDGTEATLNALLSIPRVAAAVRGNDIEVSTSCGRRVARKGSWITRDNATLSVRLYEDGLFQAKHEAIC